MTPGIFMGRVGTEALKVLGTLDGFLSRPPGDHLAYGRLDDMGRAGLLLGTDIDKGREVWLTNGGMRRHVVALGGTPAGRSAFVDLIVAQAVASGSGCIVLDPADGPSRIDAVRACADRHDRGDDVLVLDLRVPHAASGPPDTNTFNPFATGRADDLARLMASLPGPDDPSTLRRTLDLATGLMRVLVHLRDAGGPTPDADLIRRALPLRELVGHLDPTRHPDLTPAARHPLSSYLASLPGFRPEAGHAQTQACLDLHGHVEAGIGRVLGLAADACGHVPLAGEPDVDLADVIGNRRILVVTLPVAPDDRAILGRLVLGALRIAMASRIGADIEGSWGEVVDRREAASRARCTIVAEGVAGLAVDGLDTMAAQSRALGFCLVHVEGDARTLAQGPALASIVKRSMTRLLLGGGDPAATLDALGMLGGGPTLLPRQAHVAPRAPVGATGVDEVMALGERGMALVAGDRMRRLSMAVGQRTGGC